MRYLAVFILCKEFFLSTKNYLERFRIPHASILWKQPFLQPIRKIMAIYTFVSLPLSSQGLLTNLACNSHLCLSSTHKNSRLLPEQLRWALHPFPGFQLLQSYSKILDLQFDKLNDTKSSRSWSRFIIQKFRQNMLTTQAVR